MERPTPYPQAKLPAPSNVTQPKCQAVPLPGSPSAGHGRRPGFSNHRTRQRSMSFQVENQKTQKSMLNFSNKKLTISSYVDEEFGGSIFLKRWRCHGSLAPCEYATSMYHGVMVAPHVFPRHPTVGIDANGFVEPHHPAPYLRSLETSNSMVHWNILKYSVDDHGKKKGMTIAMRFKRVPFVNFQDFNSRR